MNAYAVDGHCFCDTDTGMRYPGRRDWKGRQHPVEGDRIGLLLDLDQGTMTVYKNDERLGVMATGLSGKYSWAVSLYGSSARIQDAEAPVSPSAEEVAQAVAYQAPAEHTESDDDLFSDEDPAAW